MTAVDVLRWATNAAFIGLALVSVREWRRHRAPAAGWMAATFASIALVVLVGLVIPDDAEGLGWEVATRVLIAVLLLFPYFLYRFAAAFERPQARTEFVVTGLIVVTLLATAAIPDFPQEGEAEPSWWGAYVSLFLATWTLISAIVAWRLWRAGRGEPRLATRRMRLLSVAAMLLALVLVGSSTAGGSDNETATAIVQGFSLVTALLFFVGYAPPRVLRTIWRSSEVQALRRTELDLLDATTRSQVFESLLPPAAGIVGAHRVAFTDTEGTELAAHGEIPAEREVEHHDVRMRQGTLRVWTSRYAPIFGDEELQFLAFLGTIADLALDRCDLLGVEIQMRQDLQRANTELEQFAYAASHDLKEPLRVLTGFADLLERHAAETLDERSREYLGYMISSAERMNELIEDLLQLSRVGQASLVPVDVALGEVVERALDNLAAAVDESGASIVVDALPTVRADASLLVNVLQNLIGNAIKYAGSATPQVEITATARDGEVEVSVADNGEGIPESAHEKIFDPFQRLHGGDGPTGTGIGLAIVKKVVEAHGGRIWVESRPGDGATFRFTLPAG